MAAVLNQIIPLSIPTDVVTATTLSPLTHGGIVVPVQPLQSRMVKPLVQLSSWLTPPAGQGNLIEMVLAVEQDTGKLVVLTETGIKLVTGAAGPVRMRVMGKTADLSRYMQGETLALRLLARVNTGTGGFTSPTVALVQGS